MNEKLSAMMDGEVTDHEVDEVLRAMREDPELRRTWGRYHHARAAMSGEQGADLADRIAREIQDEPTVIAPGLAARARTVRQFAAGLAVAASVAAIAIVGVRQLGPQVGGKPSAQLVAQAQKTAPKSGDYIRAEGGTHWQKADPKLQNDLNLYLVEHGGFSPSMMTYVKVAGYDDSK